MGPRRTIACAAVLVAGAWFAAAAVAHHSVLPFDGTHGATVMGTVTRFLWQNPHTMIALDVARLDGVIVQWTIEAEAPRVLERIGWTQGSLEVGARITVQGAAAKDGSTVMRCREIELADGRRLPCF
jgi:hypothetical protein